MTALIFVWGSMKVRAASCLDVLELKIELLERHVGLPDALDARALRVNRYLEPGHFAPRPVSGAQTHPITSARAAQRTPHRRPAHVRRL